MKAIAILLITLYCVHAGKAEQVLRVDDISEFSKLSITRPGLVVGLQACETCSSYAIRTFESLATKYTAVTFAAQVTSSHITRILHRCALAYYRGGKLIATGKCLDEEMEALVQKLK